MSDNVSNRTFTQIRQQYEPGPLGWGGSEHLRGDEAGVRLYTHSAFSISNSGEKALAERQQKWAQGAEIVRQAIDTEYGPGIGDQVFQKVFKDHGRDLTTEVFRSDLPQIRIAIDEVRARTPFKAQLDANQTGQATIFGVGGGGQPGAVTRTPKTDAELTAMFGRSLTDNDIRGLGGIPDRCNVQLELVQLDPRLHRNCDDKMAGVTIRTDGDDPSGAFKSIEMTVYRDKTGKVHIYRDSTRSNTRQSIGDPPMERPTNLGACALVKQVDTARSLGVDTIHNFATRGKGYNGYYTWARCGGNAALTPDRVKIGEHDAITPGKTNLRDQDEDSYGKFLKALGTSDNGTIRTLANKPDLDVQDFMATDDGRKFWREHGFPLPLEFSLTPGSKTMQTFNQYTLPNSCFDFRQ